MSSQIEELTIETWKEKYGQHLDNYIIKDLQNIIKGYFPKYYLSFENVTISCLSLNLQNKKMNINSEMSCSDILSMLDISLKNIFTIRFEYELLGVNYKYFCCDKFSDYHEQLHPFLQPSFIVYKLLIF